MFLTEKLHLNDALSHIVTDQGHFIYEQNSPAIQNDKMFRADVPPSDFPVWEVSIKSLY